MSFREHQVAQHAERLREGVYEGAPVPVALFAAHLVGNGALGLDMTLRHNTTVEQMVDHYVSNADGQRELAEWAKDEAREQQVDAEIERGAA